MALTDEQIKEIRDNIKNRLTKEEIVEGKNSLYSAYELIKSKLNLDSWTKDDVQEMVFAFGNACSSASQKICVVVQTEGRAVAGKLTKLEYCPACFITKACGAYTKDAWHRSLTKAWFELKNILRDKNLETVLQEDKDKVASLIQEVDKLKGLDDFDQTIKNW